MEGPHLPAPTMAPVIKSFLTFSDDALDESRGEVHTLHFLSKGQEVFKVIRPTCEGPVL
jgi:hypothetical protein